MNNLEHKDCYIPSTFDERKEMIELFFNNDITVGPNTFGYRELTTRAEAYPTLVWDVNKNLLMSYGTTNFGVLIDQGYNPLTKREFLRKAGISDKKALTHIMK